MQACASLFTKHAPVVFFAFVSEKIFLLVILQMETSLHYLCCHDNQDASNTFFKMYCFFITVKSFSHQIHQISMFLEILITL